MGLWLERTAPAWGAGDDFLARLGQAVIDAVPDPAWRALCEVHASPAELGLDLHPAAERLHATLDGDRLTIAANTIAAGPGYHAFVVDVLDRAADALGLTFDPPGEDEPPRDLGGLQAEACAWLRTVASRVTEQLQDGARSVAISMPLGFALVDEPRVASPLGLWDPAWFQETASLEGDTLAARAAAFFPWWGPALDATAWARAGLTTAWVDVPWRAPRTDAEEADVRRALTCLSRARALDPAAAPADLEEALRRLLEERGRPLVPPTADGVGFRRRVMSWPLAGGWSIELPGYYTSTVEREGQTEVLWFPGRTVRVSTITARDERGRPASPQELLRIAVTTEGKPLSFTRGHLEGQAVLSEEEDQGDAFFTLQGGVAGPGELCVLTISFQAEADRQWAVDTWASAFHPGPTATA